MSRYNAEFLYALLPEVYRTRDAERGYPLRDLVTILASQSEVVERDIARLYDNHFIETCEPSLVPYLGGLIGVRALPPLGRNGRAEVANTIRYRRRKGTAAVLEDLARDVTGWPAHAVEFFELLPTTQYMNHLRLHRPRTPDLRQADALDHVNRAFDTAAHTVDVRHIASRRGKHNIPNVGLYLFRLGAQPLQLVQPTPIGDPADARYTFSTIGVGFISSVPSVAPVAPDDECSARAMELLLVSLFMVLCPPYAARCTPLPVAITDATSRSTWFVDPSRDHRYSGSATVTLVPRPTLLASTISPPCSATSRCASARPSPA
jgi:hypothetical protein